MFLRQDQNVVVRVALIVITLPGSPYVKITERDGKFDSWVVLPLREFQEIYQNSIDLVRRHLFGAPLSHKEYVRYVRYVRYYED